MQQILEERDAEGRRWSSTVWMVVTKNGILGPVFINSGD
jgi:hypothetical protein